MRTFFSLPPPLDRLLCSHARCTALAAVLAVACYWNSLQGGLVHDDIFAIRDNPDVRPDTPLTSVFSNDFWGKPMSSNVSHKSYRPLTVLTFRANYAVHGLEPWGYHLVNVALHAVATALVGLLCRLLVFPEPDLAFLVSCLFATHPVHTEAVAGVVGRAELLSCICFILSVISYTTSLPHNSSRQTLGVCGCVVMGGVAMLFKETGATVVGVCLAYDLLIHSRHQLWRCLVKKTSPILPSLSPLLLRCGSLLLSSSLLLIARVSLLHGHLPHFSDHDNPASFSPHTLTRSLTYSYLAFFNAGLLVFPLTLCYDWQMGSIPLVESLGDTRNGGTVLLFVSLSSLSVTALCRLHQRSSRVVLLSLLLAVVPFLPASNLLLRVGFTVAERVLYIPSIGYCILVVQGIKTLSLRLRPPSHPHRIPNKPRPLLLLLCVVLVCVFSARTVVRNPVWHSRESLFRSGLATVPHNAKIHYNYANYLRDSGRTQEAAHHYSLALKLAPDHVSSHNNLGSLPGVTNEEAEFHFREAVRYNPTHYRAFYNLGNNLFNQGRLEEAEEALRESLKINGDYPGSLMTLATILSDSGRSQEGLRLMERAMGVAPQDTLIRNNMAAFLIRQGRVQEAIEQYQYSLSLVPSQPATMTSLARAHRSLGNNGLAEQWFLKSLALQEEESTYESLGALYFNTGRYLEARHTYSKALAFKPLHLKSQCGYLRCLVQLGQLEEAESGALSSLPHHSHPHCLHLILGSLYSQNNSTLDKAYRHSTLALGAADVQARAEANLIFAGVLKDWGQLDKAEQSYRQAIALSPTMVNAHMNLGVLLHITKRCAEARHYYEKALSLDPENKLVTDNLAKLNRVHNKQHSTS